MVIETVGIIFLMCRNDVVEPRILTEEPEDHVFGNCRMQKREFTVAELITMERRRRAKAMDAFKSSLKKLRPWPRLKDVM